MKKTRFRLGPCITSAVIAAVTFGLALVGASLLVHGLGSILYALGEEQFGAIFSQISEAPLGLPVLITLAACLAWGAGLYALLAGESRRRLRVVLAVILVPLVLLLVTALTVWLTRVNGIRVSSVARSLLRYLKNGIADKL